MERGGQEKLLVLVPAQEQALQSHELQILSWAARLQIWMKSSHSRLLSFLSLQIALRVKLIRWAGSILCRLKYLFPVPHFRVQTCPRERERE